MIHIRLPVITKYSFDVPMQKMHALRVPACAMFKSIALDMEPACMAMQIVNEDIGVPIGTMVELGCNGSSVAIRASNIALLIESSQSLSYIDTLSIGTLDPMQVGEIPSNTTS